MNSEILTALFDPEHVLSLVFYLSFIFVGLFLFKNWRSILEHLGKRTDLRHKVEMERIASEERVAVRWQNAMSDISAVLGAQNDRLTATEAQMSVLVQSIERLFRHLVNGSAKKLMESEADAENDISSRG
jgi:HAMP domain-containing protein